MGWSINEVENTVVVPEEFADKLFTAGEGEHFWGGSEDILDDEGHMMFDPDSMEHMDYLWDDDIRAVLKEARVNGRVVFSSSEGDNRGTWWSYTFKDGVVTENGGNIKDAIQG